jgi:hypothetical protein
MEVGGGEMGVVLGYLSIDADGRFLLLELTRKPAVMIAVKEMIRTSTLGSPA